MSERMFSYMLTAHAVWMQPTVDSCGATMIRRLARSLPRLAASANGLQLVSAGNYDPQATFPDTGLYQYVLAANGVFAWSRRPGLEVLIPVEAWRVALPELPVADLLARLDAPIPHADLLWMRDQARTRVGEAFCEMLFHGVRQEDGRLTWCAPPQERRAASVRPTGHEAGEVIVELHTHPADIRGFSDTDICDETGLRLNLMLEGVDDVRCSVYASASVFGHRFYIPAGWVCEGLTYDPNAEESDAFVL